MTTARSHIRTVVIAMLVSLTASVAVRAQIPTVGAASSPKAPRVAVVLSGGGAKGIAHIGVLKVLEDAGIAPQIVTGTSMGALVGGLYAMGFSPESLDSLVRRLDWPSYFSDAANYEMVGIDRRRVGDRTLISVPMKNWRLALPSGAIALDFVSTIPTRRRCSSTPSCATAWAPGPPPKSSSASVSNGSLRRNSSPPASRIRALPSAAVCR